MQDRVAIPLFGAVSFGEQMTESKEIIVVGTRILPSDDGT
jgi:hypothetical protein